MPDFTNDNQITPFAVTNFRNRKQRFGIKRDDRRRHTYVIGKTGMGKSTMLENMAIADIRNGNGLAVVDPHGDVADKLLDFVPEERVDDVIYFNPGDLDHPIALNVVEETAGEQRHLVTDGLVGIFEKQWAYSWGPRLEYILRNAILALLDVPGATLLSVMRLLADDDYRNWAVSKVKDPVIKQFWIDEFGQYAGSFASEAVAPIQNKVGQLTSNPMIRNIIGQTKTAIDFRKVMDEGKILIINLAKGKVGEGGSQLLGAMMITKLQLAAMERVNVPESQRKDFYLYVDEFQNFATQSFAAILSEARKYRLNLILAHQYIAQMTEEVQEAVFGNVGTIVSFRVGSADAEALTPEFEPRYGINDFVNLPKYNIMLKLMIDGVASQPFSATTLPPYDPPAQSFREEIIQRTRETLSTPRAEVEETIREWAGSSDDDDMFETICSRCGAETLVPFEPDDKRPVYCKKCMAEVQKKKQEAAERRKEQEENNGSDDAEGRDTATSSDDDDGGDTKRREATNVRLRRDDHDAHGGDEGAGKESTQEENDAPAVPHASLASAVTEDQKKRTKEKDKKKGPNVQGLRSALQKALDREGANETPDAIGADDDTPEETA